MTETQTLTVWIGDLVVASTTVSLDTPLHLELRRECTVVTVTQDDETGETLTVYILRNGRESRHLFDCTADELPSESYAGGVHVSVRYSEQPMNPYSPAARR